MSVSLTRLSAVELRAGYAQRLFSPPEVVAALADRLATVEPRIHAFTVNRLLAADVEARASERRWTDPALVRPLEGVPFAVKDMLDTQGMVTEYGCAAIFGGHVPARDARSVALLRRAGAVLIGKTTTHQFGLGITTYQDAIVHTKNPWSLNHVAGGSSGGSAAALAGEATPLALGTDTAGSVRIPADFCGVVGMRPTHGSISNAGAFAMAPQLDQVGPMARVPRDVADAFAVLSGLDSLPSRDASWTSGQLAGRRVGVCSHVDGGDAVGARAVVLTDIRAVLIEHGADVVSVVSPEAENCKTMGDLLSSEVVKVHCERGLWPAKARHYAPDARARMERAERLPAAAVEAARARRESLDAEYRELFERIDVLLTLGSGSAPARIDSPVGGGEAFRTAVMSQVAAQSVCGLPACVMRGGFDADGLPVGVQLTARRGADLVVLGVAQAMWDATPDVQSRRPTFDSDQPCEAARTTA